MTLYGHLEFAFGALLANKMRSALAMLGVIVGVASVIVMVSIGLGARQSVSAQVQALGSNLLGVFPGSTGQFGVRQSLGTVQTLTRDAEAIAAAVPEVEAAAPEFARPAQVVHGSDNATINISGVTPAFQHVRNFYVREGTFFSDADLAVRARAAVLGRTAVERLFGDRDATPLGAVIKINRVPFSIIGIMDEKGFDGYAAGTFFRSGPGLVAGITGPVLLWIAACEWIVLRLRSSRRLFRFYVWSERAAVTYVVHWILIAWGLLLVGYRQANLGATVALMAVVLTLTHHVGAWLSRSRRPEDSSSTSSKARA